MRFGLQIVRGARSGDSVQLEDGQTAILGRGTDTSVRIQDPSISRRHCQISNTPRGLLIADLGSSNGTYVNGQRLKPGWAQLSPGDQVILGQNEVRVVSMEAPPTPATPTAAFAAAGMAQAMNAGGAPACVGCNRPITPTEIRDNRYRQDTNGRLICAACLSQYDFDPNLIEGYRLEKKLGQGAFGSVYKAVHLQSNQVVALKTIRPQLVSSERDVARFMREAETGQQLIHPHILRIHDHGQSNGHHYIAMEYIPGKEVSKLIQEYGRLDVGYAMRVGIQIGNALQHAYEKSIVHRDIKPDNIMVVQEPRRGVVSKLVDFGLAKCFSEAGQSGLTAPGEGMGTLAYMPPEQLDNALNADQRADIYALGATIYHMLAGQRPFNEKTTRSFIMKILHHEPQPLPKLNPQVPQELADIIARAMAKKPEDRYQEPRELENELTELFKRLAAQYAQRQSRG